MHSSEMKVAWRSFRKNGFHSAVSFFGLAFGLACCLLLILWIRDELSFDRFHAKADRIIRLESSEIRDGSEDRMALTPAPLAPALLAEFPEVEKAVRIGSNGFQVAYGNRQFLEEIFFADPSILEVFDLPLVKGDARTALSDRSKILLSEDAARKYFAGDDPIGKILTTKDYRPFTVAGVFRDIPSQSHIDFDFLGQFEGYAGRTLNQWGIYNYYTYLLMKPGFPWSAFLAKLPSFVKTYQSNIPPAIKFRYEIQPLTRIHLYGRSRGEIEVNGRAATIFIFSAVALLILLIACFNYINFAMARYASRMREVGVRKAVGADRRDVALQFLRESVFTSLAALAAAFLLAEILLPAFSALTAKPFSANFLRYPGLLAAGLGLGILTGIVAGSYPAFILSAAPPAQVLKGTAGGRLRAAAVRNGLVVVQFSATIVFLIGALVIARQMRFVRTMDLGLDKERVLALPVQDETALARFDVLEDEVRKLPGVAGAAASSFRPGPGVWRQNYWREGMGPNEYPSIAWLAVDASFCRTLGISLAAGRDFSPERGADIGTAYLINEAAVRALGWSSPEETIGRPFKIVDRGTIIGVVKNFHFDSLHKEVEPLVLCIFKPGLENLYVRLRPGSIAGTLAGIKRVFAEMAPRQEFAFAFLDEEFDNLYKADARLGRVFAAVAGAAIVIAGLGLLGLAAYAARCRTREIGVRKILGASSGRLTAMMTGDFLRWILAANVIAWPLAYFAMNRWLRNFAFRAPFGLWIPLAAGGLTAILAALAVGVQALRAARANPADALRYE